MIKTLRQLAKEDPELVRKEYGEKAEGLAELIRRNKGKYIVDRGFGIPSSIPIRDTQELRYALYRLTYHEKKPRLLIARSSDKNEAPGVFESHTFMWTPRNWKQCKADLIEACEKVRHSGAGGIVCQLINMELSEIQAGYDNDFNPIEKPCFGADRIGFVYNSHSRYFRNSPVVTSACGLVSKLVGSKKVGIIDKERNVKDVSLIFDHPLAGLRVINPGHDYHGSSFSAYEQKKIDVIFLDNPKETITLNAFPGLGAGAPLGYASTPFQLGDFHPRDLFEIMKSLKTDEKEIEIEGDVPEFDENRGQAIPHFFQLRRYHLPESRLEKLTQVNPDKLLAQSENAYVADKFSGNLILLDKMKPYCVQEGQIAMVSDYHSISCSGEKADKTKKFVKDLIERKARGLIIPVVESHGHYAKIHEMGLMIQELWLLQKEIPVIAVEPHVFGDLERITSTSLGSELSGRVSYTPYGKILHNVTVESDDEQAQIYWNEKPTQ